jgi:hypothetical protein
MTLLETFAEIEDPRRSQGKRISLPQLLSMVTLSYLCGYYGYRRVARFCKAHSELLTTALGLKHKIPSHVTFRAVLMNLDSDAVIAAFNAWASCYVPLAAQTWLSGDGKALRSTVINSSTAEQDLELVVSFFTQQSGMVARIAHFCQSSGDEINTVRDLLAYLPSVGLIVRLDSAHCQKKQ